MGLGGAEPAKLGPRTPRRRVARLRFCTPPHTATAAKLGHVAAPPRTPHARDFPHARSPMPRSLTSGDAHLNERREMECFPEPPVFELRPKGCDGDFLSPSHMDVGRNHPVSMRFRWRGRGEREERATRVISAFLCRWRLRVPKNGHLRARTY